MVDTSWTFAVVFIAIFSVLVVFAVLWLMEVDSNEEADHEAPVRSPQSTPERSSRRAARVRYEPGSASSSGAGRHPAGLAHP